MTIGTTDHRQRPRLLRATLALLLAGLALSLLLGGVSRAAPADLPTISHDQIVAAIISQISTRTLEYELAGLTGERPVTVAGSLYTITTRHSFQTEPISMATRYAYEQLAALGLDVTYYDYQYAGYQLRNVVAEKPGVVNPDEIYLITAHLDSRAVSWPHDPAPGADDNGSGSIAVLMAARLLAHHRFAYTVRFVLFTGEEQGLRGSAAYAGACRTDDENIQGVVNLDMVAYDSDAQPIIDLYTCSSLAPNSPQLTHTFSDVISIYCLSLTPHYFDVCTGSPIQYSDQWSFLTQGYPAFLAIEDMDDFTPYYHQTSDRISTLDLDYYADATRAAVATIAHLGRLLPGGYLSGTVAALDTSQPLSGATVAALATAYPYTFTAVTNGSGVYSLPLPVSAYTLTAWARSPGYYPATITGAAIIADAVTLQNLALEPWPRWYLPLVAHEP